MNMKNNKLGFTKETDLLSTRISGIFYLNNHKEVYEHEKH